MSDETVIIIGDGSKWSPSSSVEKVECVHCSNEVDTPAEIASYPSGRCPDCGKNWVGTEKRSTAISVTAPAPILGES
jgi:DNA-directed RNA polymerase subunit RPC12/RpoP